jgi:hypothetical protein
MEPIHSIVASVLARGEKDSLTAARNMSKSSFVASISLAMVAITVVSFCLARRLVNIRDLASLPLARWCEFFFSFFLSLLCGESYSGSPTNFIV